MLKRLIFAGIMTLLFLTSAVFAPLVVWMSRMSWAWFAVTALLMILGVIQIVRFPAIRGACGAFLSFCLRTNNRWWVCMVLMTITSIYLAIGQEPGGKILSTGEVVRVEETEPGNVSSFRAKHTTYEPTEAETGPQVPEVLTSWKPWWIRFLTALVFVVTTIVYTFFAFSDEVGGAARVALQHVSERAGGKATEGSMFLRLIQGLLGIGGGGGARPQPRAPGETGPAPAPAQSSGHGSIRQIFWANFLAELAARFIGRR